MSPVPPGVKMTPMMAQYAEWKALYPDCILLFRMGDFYEMFFDDAKTASEVLDITLTARDAEKSIPMAGVPWHSLNSYLGRLVKAGFKAAICEQVGEPDGKALVERQVVRIVTPGTYVPEEAGTGGRLAAVMPAGKEIAAALLSAETGRLEAGVFPPSEASSLIASFAPGELLFPAGFDPAKGLPLLSGYFPIVRPADFFSPAAGSRWLAEEWGVATLASFGMEDGAPEAGCAAAALKYFSETQFGAVKHVRGVYPLRSLEYLHLDVATQRNLELLDDGPSLFSVLDRCRSPMGRRSLKEWILRPLLDIAAINRRLDGVEWLMSHPAERRRLRELLAGCRDVERAAARLSMNSGNPRDLGAIRDTLALVPDILHLASESPLDGWTGGLPDLSPLGEELISALAEDLPRMKAGGPIIRAGYDQELDGWRQAGDGESSWLESYLEKIREETGIPRIKAGYNKVFGYYLEVGRAAAVNMPGCFIRKQTLVNAERFITPEMKAFEEKMESAAAGAARREEELYCRLVEAALERVEGLQALGRALASLDVLASLAEAAREMGYVRPAVNDGLGLTVKNGRHPVVEKVLTDSPFVPNSFALHGSAVRIALITGPNMAGKSTYLRSAALLTVMAQMGSFIPAESAEIGLCDRVFTRIGARDDLARGSSTFMVEMLETANILHNVTDRSLVILDEVGRGTSTYDGMSIAWAVLEYLAEGCGALPKVLFATHYHELTCLEDRFPCIENLTMAVKEEEGLVFFLHQVTRGSADRSYGIEVARLAGMPRAVLRRAFDLLQGFEREDRGLYIRQRKQSAGAARQLTLFDTSSRAVVEELASLDPDSLTPFRALELLYKLRDKSREVVRPEDYPSS